MAAKTRSRNYPAFGLGEAIARARELYAQDGKAQVPSDVAVQAWGYGSINGASLRVLGALRQYGLLDDPAPRTVKLSARALTILLEPENSPERASALREAAQSPTVFGELLEQYGADLPSDTAIVSHLVRNENFSEDGARSLIAAFRDTLNLVGKGANANIAPKRDTHSVGSRQDMKDEQRRITPPPRTESEGGFMEFNWPLSGDAVATLTVSRQLEPDDIETLVAYFEIAKKALAKAARPKPQAGTGENQTEASAT